MFNLSHNDIKRNKKKYSIILRNKNAESYRLHEKILTNINHSIQSNVTSTTASKSNTTKTFTSRNQKVQNREKNNYKIIKCSYLDFLELRKPKNTVPFGNKEKRFKWQNLKDENIILYPEIYKKPYKKQILLRETYDGGILGFINHKKEINNKPRIKRLRQYNSTQENDINFIQNIDFNQSRRVILPLYNNEPEKRKNKRSFSQSKFIYHKTNGGLKSLFELTPFDIPIKGRKLFKTKSYGAININLFDKNYGKFELPSSTKKHFIDNRCYYDNIKEQDLISDMNYKRSRTVCCPEFKTRKEFYIYENIDNLRLRDYIKNNFKKDRNKSKSKIKRNIKKKVLA